MERLPYIDEHAITIDADREETWSALMRGMCRNPHDPSTVPTGFVLDEARRPERFALSGRHPFATYRLVFELEAKAPHRTRLRATSWADFPGVHGKLYRALVIGSGGHRVVMRRMLNRIAAHAVRSEADYTDVFEAAIPPGDSRTAEQMLRDALGDEPGQAGTLVLWTHRHVLRLRLGPYSSPEHVIGWPIMHSDRDEIVLATDGPLMSGHLTLRREGGRRAILTTRVHYCRKIAARKVWAVVGPLHRLAAARLVQRSARPATVP